jgi:hypothetical protein
MNRAISAKGRTVWQSTSGDKKIQYEKLIFHIMKHKKRPDRSNAGTKRKWSLWEVLEDSEWDKVDRKKVRIDRLLFSGRCCQLFHRQFDEGGRRPWQAAIFAIDDAQFPPEVESLDLQQPHLPALHIIPRER